MPNWCDNSIEIRHADPAMLDRVMKAKDGFLMEFFPTPQPLIDTARGYFGPDKEKEQQEQMEKNIKEYGYSDWYNWNVANWGTKWDVNFDTINRVDDHCVSGTFQSAWAPPLQAYDKLMELGFSIDATYDEPGMAFCGRWVNGDDQYIDYGGMSIQQMEENIDPDVDAQFGIIEMAKQMEKESEEE
jgi:hypothetical protein